MVRYRTIIIQKRIHYITTNQASVGGAYRLSTRTDKENLQPTSFGVGENS
jgi:hypothetical protein